MSWLLPRWVKDAKSSALHSHLFGALQSERMVLRLLAFACRWLWHQAQQKPVASPLLSELGCSGGRIKQLGTRPLLLTAAQQKVPDTLPAQLQTLCDNYVIYSQLLSDATCFVSTDGLLNWRVWYLGLVWFLMECAIFGIIFWSVGNLNLLKFVSVDDALEYTGGFGLQVSATHRSWVLRHRKQCHCNTQRC